VLAGGTELASNAELGNAAHRAGWGGMDGSDAEDGWARRGWCVSASHTPFTTRDISSLMRATST
jgi:hypothetical protein